MQGDGVHPNEEGTKRVRKDTAAGARCWMITVHPHTGRRKHLNTQKIAMADKPEGSLRDEKSLFSLRQKLRL